MYCDAELLAYVETPYYAGRAGKLPALEPGAYRVLDPDRSLAYIYPGHPLSSWDAHACKRYATSYSRKASATSQYAYKPQLLTSADNFATLRGTHRGPDLPGSSEALHSRLLRCIRRARAVDAHFSKRQYSQDLPFLEIAPVVGVTRDYLRRFERGDLLRFPLRLVHEFITHIQAHWPLNRSVRDLTDFLAPLRPGKVGNVQVLEYLKRLGDRAVSTRGSEYVMRAKEEAEALGVAGWYCIFETLTVDEVHLVEARDLLAGDGWNAHVQRRAEEVRQACGFVQGQVPRGEYIRYLSVVEFGAKTGRPHVHVLWWMRDVPRSWKHDPNQGLARPIRIEVQAAKASWRYGICQPKMVRTSSGDAWGMLGHEWPVDPRTYKPLQGRGPVGAALYISGYLTKGGDGPWRSRVRMTQGYGCRRIDEELMAMPRRLLRPVAALTANSEWLEDAIYHLGVSPSFLKLRARKMRLHRCLAAKPTLTMTLICRKQTPSLCSRLSGAWPEIGNFLMRSSHWSERVFSALSLDIGGFDSRREEACRYVMTVFPRIAEEHGASLCGRRTGDGV